MAKSDMLLKLGSYAFLIGIIIALLVGIVHASTMEAVINEDDPAKRSELEKDIFFTTETGGAVAWVLAILGAIVGLLAAIGRGTITKQETPGFLLAGIGLIVLGGVFSGGVGIGMTMALEPWIGSLLSGVTFSLAIFVAPIVGILAIKSIWDMGKDV